MNKKLNLNESQIKAVNHLNGPAIVIAGPGSGKTRVITSRVYTLINDFHILPNNIIVITFTRASAADMRVRFASEFKNAGNVSFSTIHSLFYRIMKVEGWFNEKYILTNNDREADLFNSHKKDLECDDNTDIDFDLMLDDAFYYLTNNKRILNKYQEKYKYILIDEFQDTSKREFRLIRLLALKYNNIFVVGDDDQSIYGFRNGNNKIMQTFINEYNPAKYYLCQNYRCARKIVKLSMRLINHNVYRLDKEIISMRPFNGIVKRIYLNDK